MKAAWARWTLCLAILIAVPLLAQKQTLARLNHELDVEASRSALLSNTAHETTRTQPASVSLLETPASRAAARALFVHSDITRARLLANQALRQNRLDAEALFVKMEAASMQADQPAMLDAAVRLCAVASAPQQDVRVSLAAARLREAASNTRDFRQQIPRIQAILANSAGNWPALDAALLAAAMDGAPGLDPYTISRAAGILTDWRIVGPLDRQALADFDKTPLTGSETLNQSQYGGHAVENFQFPDGTVRLPEYLSRRGIFYAASSFAALNASRWSLQAQTIGMVEVSIDGMPVLRRAQLATTGGILSATIDITPGPHRVLAKFAGSAAPLRISITPALPKATKPSRAHVSAQQLAYELAAQDYAAGSYQSAIDQLQTMPAAMTTAPLIFLLAQAQTLMQGSPTTWDADGTWKKLLVVAGGALAADVALAQAALANREYAQAAFHARRVLAVQPTNTPALEVFAELAASANPQPKQKTDAPQAWSELLAQHSSCETLKQAVAFYRKQNYFQQASATERRLEGCAPESLAYAQSLSEQGGHAEAAAALRDLLAGAPLNRAAHLMLIRELQLAGQDPEARKAAAEWLQVAPNASSFRRLATQGESPGTTVAETGALNADSEQPFYAPYRRQVPQLTRHVKNDNSEAPTHDAVLLLNDHVAISRPDGSVSLYVHRATRILSLQAASRYAFSLPEDAQLLQLRTITAQADFIDAQVEGPSRTATFASLLPGDIVEEEYVVNYSGDGGIAEHSEAFQFVFGSFDVPVVSARFVVLTPADQADQGVVIATGDAPKMSASLDNGMLARVWEKVARFRPSIEAPNPGLAIIRVVEQENGWMVPRNAERQRRIETIHPGPRFEES